MATRDFIRFQAYGNFNKTRNFLNAIKKKRIYGVLEKYGQLGAQALAESTPVDTGKTASSWYYKTEMTDNSYTLSWFNSSMGNDGKTPVVILIMYGHGTRTGGYVAPNDFVTPTMKRLFEDAADAVWKEVRSLG